MAQTTSQIATEIDELRDETDAILDELVRRADPRAIAQGLAGSVAETATEAIHDISYRVPEPVRRNPQLVEAVGGLLLGISGFTLFSRLLGERHEPAVLEETKGTANVAREEADRTLVRLLHRLESVGDEAVVERRRPSMLKRLMWVALASMAATLGSMLFRRMSEQLWRSTLKEEPPEEK